jgi:plastocyanin
MTWVLRIFFSAVIVLAAAVLPALAGTVRGSLELMASRDPMVRKHKDYSGVVVWLEPARGLVPLLDTGKAAQMIQKNKTFTPHVLAIPVGASISFPNLDPIFHSAFSNFNGQIFDLALYKPGSSRTVAFKRPGIVRVFCNIHPQMSAVIAVLDTPYFAVSNKAGTFEIDGVPPGDYQFHIFHEGAAAETLDALTRKISVETALLELPRISVNESGYLQVPHKNKYGKDYPPVIEDRPAYSGTPK